MERREEETRLESEKNIKKLTNYIEEKEKNLWKNDKIIDINDEENSFMIKYKHIIDPNEQTMILNQEINEYKKLLKQLYRLIKDLKSKNLDLTQTNYVILSN